MEGAVTKTTCMLQPWTTSPRKHWQNRFVSPITGWHRKQAEVFFLHVFLPAVDGSGLQCVSMILIRLVLFLTDLRELFVDLLYN